MSPNNIITAVLRSYGGEPPHGKADRWVPMQCPFHGDEIASAALNINAGRFVCHGCMTHSEDAPGLIMWQEDCDYRTAVRRCESLTGESCGEVCVGTARPAGLSGLLG